MKCTYLNADLIFKIGGERKATGRGGGPIPGERYSTPATSCSTQGEDC